MEEARLHAYIDRELAPELRDDVERELRDDPELAARARAYVEQNASFHLLYDDVLNEPHRIRLAPPQRTAGWRSLHINRYAALAFVLFLGIAIGFALRTAMPERTPIDGQFARQAAIAHATYQPEVLHPVEVAAAEEKHLTGWLSKRLSAPLRVPSLKSAGYQLLGGRLLPAASAADPAPVALLMYENEQGRRLSLLVKREARNEDVAFRFSQNGPTRVFYWIDGPFGYALAGDISREELQALATRVYEQLN